MQPRPSVIVTLVTILLCALPLFAQDQTTNASFSTGTKEAIPVNVLVGQSRVISFDRSIDEQLDASVVATYLRGRLPASDRPLEILQFPGGHANLTSTGTVISVASLGVGRAAMRKQKGLQSEELNLAPSYLIGPAALESIMYQFTSEQFVPALSGSINEFRRGGRTAVEPVVEALLDANSATAWYLAAENGQIDTVEFCYLDGAEGPMIESEMGFEVDGISYKCRLDFAAKAIDFRGLYKNNGA